MKKKHEKWLHAKCVGCGGCCTNSVVPVNDSDVKRIAKHTGLKADKIVRFVDSSAVEPDEMDDSWVELSYGKRFMALRRAKDRCMFLDDNNLCTIYEARPMTCRTFPLQIYLTDDDKKIEKITLNRMIKDKYPLAKEKTKTKKTALKQAIKEDRQDNAFWDKIAKWNKKKKKGGKDAFLKFLGL